MQILHPMFASLIKVLMFLRSAAMFDHVLRILQQGRNKLNYSRAKGYINMSTWSLQKDLYVQGFYWNKSNANCNHIVITHQCIIHSRVRSQFLSEMRLNHSMFKYACNNHIRTKWRSSFTYQLRVKIFSDDMTTTWICLKAEDSCWNQHKSVKVKNQFISKQNRTLS